MSRSHVVAGRPRTRKIGRCRATGEQGRIRAKFQRAMRAGAARFVVPDAIEPPPGWRLAEPHEERAALLGALSNTGRADARANQAALVESLLRHRGSRPDGLIIASHRMLAEDMTRAGTPVGRSCAGEHVRALEATHVLHCVQPGTSAEANGTGRNMAPVYVVLVRDELDADSASALLRLTARLSRHPLVVLRDLVKARGANGRTHGRNFKRSIRVEHPERFWPRGGRERELATMWLAQVLGLDWDAYGAELLKISRGFYAAGWTAQAIAWAAVHDPNPAAEVDQPVTAGRKALPLLVSRLARWRVGRVWCGAPVNPPMAPMQPRRGPAAARASDYVQPPGTGAATVAPQVGEAVQAAKAAVRELLAGRRHAVLSHRGHLAAVGLL